ERTAARGEADAESRRRRGDEPSLAEESPPRGVLLSRELGYVELLRREIRRQQPRPIACLTGGPTALLVVQLNPDALREPLDRLREGEVVDPHEEVDDPAALSAAEAVERADARPDVEARALIVVERAQALERAHPGTAERDV